MNQRPAFAALPSGRMEGWLPDRAAGREGRQAAREVDRFLTGSTVLPR